MYEGVLNVYKERGYTSFDVIARLRGILKMKRIGHMGTLDPEAEGVLPVCLGRAARLCDMLTEESKRYETVMLLGVETDTQDTTGTVLRRAEVQVTEEEVAEVIQGFVGACDQIPPMYSALKVNGKKLCDLARQGKTVERAARRVEINRIDLISVDLPRVTMAVTCSRGTYIRTLCHDIGQRLGCGACMEKLLRVMAAGFRVEDSLRLAEIERLRDEGSLEDRIVPVERMLAVYPAARIRPEADRAAYNGNPLEHSRVCRLPEKPGSSAELPEQPDPPGSSAELPETAAGDFGAGQPEMRAETAGTMESEPPFEPSAAAAGCGTGSPSGSMQAAETALPAPPDGARFRLYDSGGNFLGVYEYRRERGCFKPWKLFLPLREQEPADTGRTG